MIVHKNVNFFYCHPELYGLKRNRKVFWWEIDSGFDGGFCILKLMRGTRTSSLKTLILIHLNKDWLFQFQITKYQIFYSKKSYPLLFQSIFHVWTASKVIAAIIFIPDFFKAVFPFLFLYYYMLIRTNITKKN